MKIAVLCPIWKRHAAFRPLLEAVLNRQTRKDFARIIYENDGPVGAARAETVRRAWAAGCGAAINFDADDMHADDRVERQMAAIEKGAAVCGSSVLYCVDLRTGNAVEKRETAGLKTSTLAFTREAYEAHPFDAKALENECFDFIAANRDAVDLRDPALVVYCRHPLNTVAPWTSGLYGFDAERATAAVRAMPDLARYRAAAQIGIR
jgi:hypothetical protein